LRKAVMIAATGSGSGKTTITSGLLEMFSEDGISVSAYKCGTDYIDPMFHRRVIGVPSENLDLFLAGEEKVREIFKRRENETELAVVEGVMGLYDGTSPSSEEASSYHLASVLDIPIILVVDAGGMGRSILAVIRGFLSMDKESRIKGIFLNRISDSYFMKIKPVIEEEIGIPVVGHLSKMEKETFSGRHLGLKMPSEIPEVKNMLETIAGKLRDGLDTERFLQIARLDTEGSDEKENNQDVKKDNVKKENVKKNVRIAVARDEAFCFYYEENLRMLEEAGAILVDFSPLHDKEIPSDVDGILLGGGYPELFAKELSQNTSMLKSVKERIEAGMPSLAECGGFLYLHEGLDVDGKIYPMVGVTSGNGYNKGKLVRFGYVELSEKESAFLDSSKESGQIIRGHEFHYYDTDDNGKDAICRKRSTGTVWEAACIGENHWWGFAHLYYPSNENFPKRFVEKCEIYKEKREKRV